MGITEASNFEYEGGCLVLGTQLSIQKKREIIAYLEKIANGPDKKQGKRVKKEA